MGNATKLGSGTFDIVAAMERRHTERAKELGLTAEEYDQKIEADNTRRDAEQAEAAIRCHRDDRLRRIEQIPLTDEDQRRIVLDELDDTEPLGAVRRWLDGNTPILVLGGTVGRGKTVAAGWAVAREGGHYMRARSFERLFSCRYGDELEQQTQILRSRLIVVDDIGGREDTAEGLAAYLLDLVDERRSSRTRTILITNQPRKVFEARYPDQRLHSRLKQSAVWVVSKGGDLRSKL